MSRLTHSLAASLSLSILLSGGFQAVVAADADADAGPLDSPLVLPGEQTSSPATTLAPSVDAQNNQIQSQEELRAVVEDEQEELEQLPHDELVDKAEQGERAAQVVLGAEFAREAAQLAFAPAAANDALSDAARWYSLAASRGFPGAPSLDQSGLRFFPIRIQRE